MMKTWVFLPVGAHLFFAWRVWDNCTRRWVLVWVMSKLSGTSDANYSSLLMPTCGTHTELTQEGNNTSRHISLEIPLMHAQWKLHEMG
jgi:hypothetical protein